MVVIALITSCPAVIGHRGEVLNFGHRPFSRFRMPNSSVFNAFESAVSELNDALIILKSCPRMGFCLRYANELAIRQAFVAFSIHSAWVFGSIWKIKSKEFDAVVSWSLFPETL